MNDLVLSALIAVGASIVVAAALVLLLHRRIAAAAAVAASYATGHVMVNGALPGFPPISTEHWLVYFAVPVLVLAVLEDQIKRGQGWRWVVRAVLGGIGVYLFLEPRMVAWSGLESAAWIGGQTLAWLFLWGALDHWARRSDGESRAWRLSGALYLFGLVIVATSTSVACLNSSSAKLAQFAGGFAASLGVCLVFAWWRPSWVLCRGASAVSAFLLIGLLSEAHHYSELPLTSAGLLVSAGLLGWIGSLPFMDRAGKWPAALARLLLTAIPALVAVYLTLGGADDASSWGH